MEKNSPIQSNVFTQPKVFAPFLRFFVKNCTLHGAICSVSLSPSLLHGYLICLHPKSHKLILHSNVL